MPDAKLDGSVIGLSRRKKIRILLVYSAIGAATALDFETMGYGIVAIFVVSWLISVVYWRHRRYDELFRNQLTSAA